MCAMKNGYWHINLFSLLSIKNNEKIYLKITFRQYICNPLYFGETLPWLWTKQCKKKLHNSLIYLGFRNWFGNKIFSTLALGNVWSTQQFRSALPGKLNGVFGKGFIKHGRDKIIQNDHWWTNLHYKLDI